MIISYMGGNRAGMVGLLTILAKKHKVVSVASYSPEISYLSGRFEIPTVTTSIKDNRFKDHLHESDIILCVHGREKVPQEYIQLTRKKTALNVHPYLYAYPGKDPVNRALEDKNYIASVGIHKMTDKYDEGEVLIEKECDVTGCKTADEVYNRLYPVYSEVIIDGLQQV